MNLPQTCLQVEEFVNGECTYDLLTWSEETADAKYDKLVKAARANGVSLQCAIAKGRGSNEHERLHTTKDESRFIRLTVRRIEP